MKHFSFTFLFTLLMSMETTKVFAYDIAVENADGVTIYYNYTNDGKELEVTARGIYSRTIQDYTHYYSTGYSNIDILKIPSEVSYMGRLRKVTSIGDHAFTNSRKTYSGDDPRTDDVNNKFTDIYLPTTIKKIGKDAFASYYSNSSSSIPLERIHIEDLSQWCMMDFYKGYFGYWGRYELLLNETVLKDINIPNGTTEINDWAFASCDNLQSATIPNSVTNIGSNAFQYCLKLTSITIPNSVTSIGNSAFSGCGNLTSITIPNSVTSIGNSAFSGCGNLTSITIPNSVTSIEPRVFYQCGLTSITIPNSVTNIKSNAFYNCRNLTSITIPNGVTNIGYGAFQYCNNLTSITIPNSVTSIEDLAFNFNNSKGDIVEINCMIMEPTDIKENTFSSDIYNNASFYIPKGTMSLYKAREGWKKFVWIEEKEMTGINNTIKNDVKNSHAYSLDGKHIIEPLHGLNIIRMKDGTVKKIIFK